MTYPRINRRSGDNGWTDATPPPDATAIALGFAQAAQRLAERTVVTHNPGSPFGDAEPLPDDEPPYPTRWLSQAQRRAAGYPEPA